MTFGENKKIALGLIEEYSKTNSAFTDDEDIATRINLLYSTNYHGRAKRLCLINFN